MRAYRNRDRTHIQISSSRRAVTPKQLAAEFDRRPAWIRKQLRARYGQVKGIGRRWDLDQRKTHEVKAWLRALISGEALS